MQFDTKIVVVLREDLAIWQKANVTAFLVSGISGSDPSTVGEPYADASGRRYLPMFRQPVLVYAAGAQALGDAHGRALARELDTAVYIEDMFKTGHDADNRATVRAVAAVGSDELDLVGIALRADRKVFDKVLDKLRPPP